MNLGRKLQAAGLVCVGLGLMFGIGLGFGRDDSKSLYFDLIGVAIGVPLFVLGRWLEARERP
ncbi:MAG: hypothetical protein H6834_16055 [Planctomycetes bacterium]|nr:hypothetical protein [Planctomycetota bacterium]